MENSIKVISTHVEDVGLMRHNTKFSNGVELIYSLSNDKLFNPRFRYLNGGDEAFYISAITIKNVGGKFNFKYIYKINNL